eukprot:TRINITY_DN20377_c0_g1_i2.p1 TRINITY_DN20377_c0_g1~~TRINITY_DN20377_c0_g1_i2.p1  ORF type:complete len:297 (-),score=51.69 TRINITY_DN20377_c0_g1_i2:66-956(-)
MRSFYILFFFQAEDGIRDLVRSRGLGDVYKRQALVQYGGGDDMRQAEALVSLALDSAVIPPGLKQTVCNAVDGALGRRVAGTFDCLTSEHLPDTYDRDALQWEAALAISTEPNAGSDWANLYFHGWLYSELLEREGNSLYAAQRFPLVGVFDASDGILAFDPRDVRSAGSGALDAGTVCPADQHIHKIDAYAGGDRDSTIALYMESGMDRDTAEAAVMASEADSNMFHVGADMARIQLNPQGGGSLAWAVCVDLEPGQPPRVQCTCLLYTSDAADEEDSGDLGGRRLIRKKKWSKC